MAMTEKQIKRRMEEAWEEYYDTHEMEAEWYPINNSHMWVCDIPSRQVTVKMKLDEELKKVIIYETPVREQCRYDFVRKAAWKTVGNYCW